MRMYQVRVTSTPFLVPLIRSIVDLSPPAMIMLPGWPIACLPCFCAQ